MACSLCRGEIYGPCPGCSAGRRSPLSDAAFQAKLARIREAGAERLQAAALRDEADIWLGPEAQPKPRADALAADVRPAVGLALAPVRDLGGEREAEPQAALTGYNRALSDSLKAAKKLLDQLSQEHGPSVFAVLAAVEEGLAENAELLGRHVSGVDIIRRGRV